MGEVHPSLEVCFVVTSGTSSETVIETDSLTKQYGSGDSAVVAVEELDLQIESGEVFGFLGPNGAGKSTTINMLLDYVRPTAGSATVLGLDVHHESEVLRKRIGVLPEGFGLYDRLSGRRHLEFAIDWKDAATAPEALLDRVGLTRADASRPVGDYSKGMQQRLALGMALAGDPDLLILDEPSSGLDPHGIRQMQELVREAAEAGKTVFFSSHILGQVEAICDRVGILYEGTLVAVDTVEGLRETVGAGSELRLRVTDKVDVEVETIEGVDSVVQTDGILRVTCSDSRAKARVIARLTDAGVDVLDVDSESASLEDVFTAYTTGGTSREVGRNEPTVEEASP
ncbi:ATP-binding cassette domain-containing protein [Halomicrococcus sp. SG-WS-1]|uniref:ABC transporter ATP-binding protein n=1 Tax=Halomicrococcus sp. SG-WS-1 TaxID=3439057 RepID=UPI003F7AF6B7